MAGGVVEEETSSACAEPSAGWASGPLGAVQAADREIARQTALRARAVAEFAATRPASADRQPGEAGCMSADRRAARPDILGEVSEWAAPELSIALNLTAQTAEQLLERSLTLVHRLPATLTALEGGLLHTGHLWHLLDKVAPIPDPAVRAAVEAELLAWMRRRQTVTTPAQLGDKARRVIARRGARDAARDLDRALRQRGVHLRPERTDGMAALTVICTLPEARALYQALAACADTLDDPDDDRTRGQKMVDCLLDLVLRPGESALPPVQVLLTVVATIGTLLGGDAPGEIDGQVVPAELIRQLLHTLTGHPSQPAQDSATAPPDSSSAVPGYSPAAGTPADPGPAEPVGVDEPPATDTPSPAQDGLDDAPASATGPAADGWQTAEQAELEDWWAETERRVLAGLADEPDRAPDLPAEDGWQTAEQAELERWWAETEQRVLAGLADEPDRAPDANPPDDPPTSGSSVPAGGGWWAAADRAVADASTAVRQAQTALGAAHRLVHTATTADTADEATWRAGPGRPITAAPDALTALTAATAAQRADLAALLAATAGGGLADRPRLALTHAATGALLALTDLPGLRRTGTCGAGGCRRHPDTCTHDLTGRPGLGAPDPTDGYRPAADLDRFLRARDRRCRFPGCRRRVPRGGELDHHTPWPAGPTSAANLAGYCTTDHRGKHQAPGWQHHLAPDGTLTVTTPTGLTAVTTPPPY